MRSIVGTSCVDATSFRGAPPATAVAIDSTVKLMTCASPDTTA